MHTGIIIAHILVKGVKYFLKNIKKKLDNKKRYFILLMKGDKMKKMTKATFKSFVNKNRDRLYISVEWYFDGMIDGMTRGDCKFDKIQPDNDEKLYSYTLGIRGCWLVGKSRDYFESYEDESYEGISVGNCCGDFVIAIKK